MTFVFEGASLARRNFLTSGSEKTFSQSRKAFLWAITANVPPAIGANTAISGNGANVVTLYLMFIPYRIKLSALSFQLTTGVNGSTTVFGFYDMNFNLVGSSGAIPTPVAAVGIVFATFPTFTLERGFYFLAQGSTSASVAAASANYGITAYQILYNANAVDVYMRRAGTGLVAGLLASTNTITASTGSGPTAVLWWAN